jgi:hypothetical protein
MGDPFTYLFQIALPRMNQVSLASGVDISIEQDSRWG